MPKPPAMRPTGEPVPSVLDRATGPRRAEIDELLAMHASVSGEEPVVWAGRIVGFGQVAYHYETGHGGVMPVLAFAPARSHHTIYLPTDFASRRADLLEALGPHRASAACLYVPRLRDVDTAVLRSMLEWAVTEGA